MDDSSLLILIYQQRRQRAMAVFEQLVLVVLSLLFVGGCRRCTVVFLCSFAVIVLLHSIRTHDILKNLPVPLFFIFMFGPSFYGPTSLCLRLSYRRCRVVIVVLLLLLFLHHLIAIVRSSPWSQDGLQIQNAKQPASLVSSD